MAAATVPLKDRIQQQYSQLLDNFTNLLRSARLPDDASDAGGRSQAQVRACFGFVWSLLCSGFLVSCRVLRAQGQRVRAGGQAGAGAAAALQHLAQASRCMCCNPRACHGGSSMLGPRRPLVGIIQPCCMNLFVGTGAQRAAGGICGEDAAGALSLHACSGTRYGF